MNPVGEFRARPSLALSIRQWRGFYIEYCREMQEEKVASVGLRHRILKAFEISLMILNRIAFDNLQFFSHNLRLLLFWVTIYFPEESKRRYRINRNIIIVT